MNSIIIYASTHHGNTKKLIDAIAEKHGVELIDATKVKEMDLTGYDCIGFASGVYGFNWHKAVIDFAAKNLPADKKIFLVSTSAMGKDFSGSFQKAIADKNPTVLGHYMCQGYNTFGPFKIVGGTAKGHPTADELAAAVKFYEELKA